MKHCIAILFFIFSAISGIAQSLKLPFQWKFKIGDEQSYKDEKYDDATWELIKVPLGWEKQGIYNGRNFAWYRIDFSLPNEMLDKDIVLLLGTIDDADETYLNGKLVGKTGTFPPNDQTAWDVERKYKVNKQWVKKHNSLAIKVYNGAGDGGITSGNLSVITLQEYNKQLEEILRNKRSYDQLTTSNGLIAAVYNAKDQVVENIYPHIFTAYDSASLVQPFATNLRIVTNEKPLLTQYVKNSHVIEVRYQNFSVFYLTSFSREDKIFYAIVKGPENIVSKISFHSDKSYGELISDSILKRTVSGSEKYCLFSFKDSLEDNHEKVKEALNDLALSERSLVNDEVDYMQSVFKRSHYPSGINADEKNLVEQSITVLKMSQVNDKEIFPLSHGQILASLRPGVWAISWVRDATYSIEALSKLGLYQEARKGLEFMLNAAPTNQYKEFIHTDGKSYGIGVDYRISVTRYFGKGREESDFGGEGGPNIELDDFGLFLIAVDNYVRNSGDTAFLLKWNAVLTNEIANAIMHNIDQGNIIRTESGPWEHHLPGKQYAFTSGVCAEGLKRLALLQSLLGLPNEKYISGYKRLYGGIMHHFLYRNNLIKGNSSDTDPASHTFYDGSTFELFANGLITDKTLFLSHMKAYDSQLIASGKGEHKGYIRFNSADSYENQEWPFATCRVAVAQCKFGNKQRARLLLQRITEMAKNNYNLIPEMYSLEESRYRGAIPMVGYGSGAYVIALFQLYK